MKYLVAVSGGVDSVVLLHMLTRSNAHELIVAHFDHGIRPDSADDARFVEGLAKRYALPFYSQREELGAGASEELARNRRYAFLQRLAAEHNATIVTGHHADDAIETIAINIQRGTGWRGLAVFGNDKVVRLLTRFSKEGIYNYALQNRLEWVEDSTNQTGQYLRNRLRMQITQGLPVKTKELLLKLWAEQTELRQMIQSEIRTLLSPNHVSSRYFFITIDSDLAVELLRAVIAQQTGQRLMRPQLERGVLEIKTVLPGAVVQLGQGVELCFKKDSFIVRNP